MHMEYDCLRQSASGAQSGASPSRIEEFRAFEADLSALCPKGTVYASVIEVISVTFFGFLSEINGLLRTN